MASNLFYDLLDDKVTFETFSDWIAGADNQTLDASVNRNDFVLHLLNYVQEESNKFIGPSLPVGSQAKGKNEETPQTEINQEKSNELKQENKSSSAKTVEAESHNHSPFKKINNLTPTKTKTQHRCLNYSALNEARRDLFNITTNPDGRNVATSTPVVHQRRNSGNDTFSPMSPRNSGYEAFPPMSPRNSGYEAFPPMSPRNSGHDSFHIMSPKSANSFQSDFSSPANTPQSGHRFNSSSGSHRFSSPSNSPTFSPNFNSNFPELGSKGRARNPQSPCLADFIVAKPQKNKKRIKPTKLTSTPEKNTDSGPAKTSNQSFGSVSRPFTSLVSPVQPQAELRETSNFQEERNLLKEKRIQILSKPKEVINIQNQTATSAALENSVEISPKQNITNSSTESASSPIEPNPSLIACTDKVVRLASVYSKCLDLNLVSNVVSELYSVFTLLTFNYRTKVDCNEETSKGNSKSQKTVESRMKTMSIEDSLVKSKDNGVLGSVHNCVMFAAAVIERQIPLIECLDKTVIKLLLDNARLALFVPHILPQLSHIAEAKEKPESQSLPFKKLSVLTNGPVLYQTETDKRDNFSSDQNFCNFKKQRDLFYAILHEWRTENSDSAWLAKRFPQKVQTLMSLSADPVNLMHLARLFTAQLTSYNNEQGETQLELPGVTKDKLSRLQARFSKPQDGPRPPPHFPAEQQFYQQFLQQSLGYPFCLHVTNCLVQRIIDLDATSFFVDGESTGESVQSCVSNCCLLAKFLGLIVFSPYICETPLNPTTLQAQIQIRQQISPPLDVMSCLKRALEGNRLTLTVPWVVSYLGMMDAAAPHLPTYRPLLRLLVSLYTSLPLSHLSPLTSLLLRSLLGWLFDISFFPEDLFYSLLSEKVTFEKWKCEPPDIDVKNSVDQTLLSELCPYLSHLRQLLLSSSNSVKRSARHITPVPAQLNPHCPVNPAHALQMQLEESFLSGQSAGFRETIDLIVDRVSRTRIEHICRKVVSSCKHEFAVKCSSGEFHKINKKKSQAVIAEACAHAAGRVEAAVSDSCGTQMETVCRTMLGSYTSDEAVLRTAHRICARRCRERTTLRLNSLLKLTDLFSKLLAVSDAKNADKGKEINTKVEATRVIEVVDKEPSQQKFVEHWDSALSPPDLLISLQNTVCSVIGQKMVMEEEIKHLIHNTIDTLTHRSDLLDAAEHVIQATSVDLCMALLATSPAVVTEGVRELLCSLWMLTATPPLTGLVSARNLLLLCQSGPGLAQHSWLALAELLACLLRRGLLSPASLEAQLIALLRTEWPPPVLNLVGMCLTSLLDKIKDDPLCSKKPKFLQMLEWLRETTNNWNDWVND